MAKYKTYMQEYLRTYDSPTQEDTAKTIISYLKFYGYVPIQKTERYVDRTYKAIFSDGVNLATLRFVKDLAILIEYDGLTEITPTRKTDFIKKERLEYLGSFRDKSIVYTCDKFCKCFYYNSLKYQGMKDSDYYNNNLPHGTMPDGVKDIGEFKPIMMRLIASSDYANEIRCMKEGEPVYNGKQVIKCI